MFNNVKSIILTVFVACTCSMAVLKGVEEKEPEQEIVGKTYVQEVGSYSITLPEGWQKFHDEKQIKNWTHMSGLYWYHYAPNQQPGLTLWGFDGKPSAIFALCAAKREAGFGSKKYFDYMQFILQSYGATVQRKGETTFQNNKCQWWLTRGTERGELYWVAFLNQNYFYYGFFAAEKLTRKCDSILTRS